MGFLFFVFALGWSVTSVLEVLGWVPAFDGMTHTESFVAAQVTAMLFLILGNQEQRS